MTRSLLGAGKHFLSPHPQSTLRQVIRFRGTSNGRGVRLGAAEWD